MYSTEAELASIVGADIKAIYWSEDRLILDTDRGAYVYEVEGDCCSASYFFDFYGVRNLLDLGPVTAFESVELAPGDPGYLAQTWEEGVGYHDYEDVRVYGYRFTVEHPAFGPVSAVLSFRNSSNGYYGGWMGLRSAADKWPIDSTGLELLTADKVG